MGGERPESPERRIDAARARFLPHQSEPAPDPSRDRAMSTILLVVLILLLIAAVPTWPHSRGWGYAPSSLIGLVLLVLVILLLMGRI